MNNDTLWYKRTVALPKGKWQYATLELKGARFAPAVFVNGEQVSRTEGGMAPSFHLLQSKAVKPGKTITIEVALTSLKQLPKTDASYIAISDHWRSNISSSLWDDVLLHVHGDVRVEKVVPAADTKKKLLNIGVFVEKVESGNRKLDNQAVLSIADCNGKTLLTRVFAWTVGKNRVDINYEGILQEWSPESPKLYQMTITLKRGKKVVEQVRRKLGIKQFEIRGKQFYLNGNPYKLRGGSFTWHRWMRSPEGVQLGHDAEWFRDQLAIRMKGYGANEINFHLGLAPTSYLDVCDSLGLLVRYEWSFFHGVPATEESCREQYARWLASSMEHPCAGYYYPYNETSGKELEKAWRALDEVLKDYPQLVMAHRDVMHLHKYWWSIFENLGVYYDNYEQFEKTVMADEFGGNYLDKNGDYGGYPSVVESFLRFCGRDNTKEQRLKQLSLSTGKVAEYWRRTDVAGWTPYTIVSSYEDGNCWFLGDMHEGNPMPVWDAMAAGWSPQAVSMDIWDVNFVPAQTITIPLHFFNDLGESKTMQARLSVLDAKGNIVSQQIVSEKMPVFSHHVVNMTMKMPQEVGNYTLKAELLNRPSWVIHPVVSTWDVHVFRAAMPISLTDVLIFTPEYEKELRAMMNTQGLTLCEKVENADVLLLSSPSWNRLAKGDTTINQLVEQAVNGGVSVIMLDVGPQSYGKGYPVEGQSLKSLLNPPSVSNPRLQDYPLFGSIIFHFKESAESETNLFPDVKNDALWEQLPADYRGMWNGLRGNLVVPAWEMEVQGVNADLFLEQWTARGADEAAIKCGQPYYAYELHGYYGFSTVANDDEAKAELKSSVMQKIEDAPSLAVFINPNIPIKQTDLAAGYKNANVGMAESMQRMAKAGRNLTKVPVILIRFGQGKGNLLVSQLLTAGRLANIDKTGKPYERRYDETAVQMVLNMIEQTINYE
ncbi:MAG: glycoside hydrolase [Bacteroidaceae bacterium]|nr:glycoside hydrolase [Bacteroidaceae bacterium]